MKRKRFFVKGFLSLLMATVAISACKKDEPTGAPSLYIEKNSFVFLPLGGEQVIELQSNVQVGLDNSETAPWCEVSLSGNTLTVRAKRYDGFTPRTTKVSVYIPGGQYEMLTFRQLSSRASVKCQVDSATASNTYAQQGIDFTFDGVTVAEDILYHSDYGQSVAAYSEVELIYYLHPSENLELAMIAYYHRQSLLREPNPGGNGTFRYVDVYVTTKDNPNWEQMLDNYNCGNPDVPRAYPFPAYINFDEPIANVTAVKIVVDCKTSKGGLASCAEMEFYGTAKAGLSNFLELSTYQHSFDVDGGSEIISVLTDADDITVSGGGGWCSPEKFKGEAGSFYITITAPKNTEAFREATLTITAANGMTKEVEVKQTRALTSDGSESELKVDLNGSEANSSQDGEGFENMLDGLYTTFWHSNYDKSKPDNGPIEAPHELTFKLLNTPTLWYIVYYPRNYPDGGNGNWWTIEVWVKSSGSDFEYVMDYNCGGKGEESKIILPKDYPNVKSVKIIVKKQAVSSCSEIRFFGS